MRGRRTVGRGALQEGRPPRGRPFSYGGPGHRSTVERWTLGRRLWRASPTSGGSTALVVTGSPGVQLHVVCRDILKAHHPQQEVLDGPRKAWQVRLVRIDDI